MNRKNTARRRRRRTMGLTRALTQASVTVFTLAEGYYWCARTRRCSVWSAVPNGPRPECLRSEILARAQKEREVKRNEEEVGGDTWRRGLLPWFARIQTATARLVSLMPRLVSKINVLSLLCGNSDFCVCKIYV